MDLDLDALTARSDQAPLSHDEIGRLVRYLHSEGMAPDAQHRALLLLARCHTADAEHALHALLESPVDPIVAAGALRTLCLVWGLGARYRGLLRHFVHGVGWDLAAGGRVQHAAIDIAGDLLASQTDTELMFDLVRISEDEDHEATRLAAVRALAHATGYHGRSVDVHLDL